MSGLQLFDSGDIQLTIEPRSDSFIVHAPGLARGLGYRDARDMLRILPLEEKGTHTVRTPGGPQEASFLTEPGLYRVLASRRPGAIRNPDIRAAIERFQRWLYHDVLPALRRGHQAAPAVRQQPTLPLSAFYRDFTALLTAYGVTPTFGSAYTRRAAPALVALAAAAHGADIDMTPAQYTAFTAIRARTHALPLRLDKRVGGAS